MRDWRTRQAAGLALLLCLTPPPAAATEIAMEVTAYSHDGPSTNWETCPTFPWRACIASGPNKGKRKIVGQTSSGATVKRGTIAADIRHYPYGTVMEIPGYGRGVVEDTGGAIKGPHRIDLYFPTRTEALRWGRRWVKVKLK